MSHSAHNARGDIAARVTARILADLDRGVLPWRKPWDASSTSPFLPRRASGEIYRGATVVLLWSAGAAQGYTSPYWLTFNQASKLGGRVRKGERGEVVIYYGQASAPRAEESSEARGGSFRFLKAYVAFNADQVVDLPDRFHPPPAKLSVMASPAHEAWFARLEIARVLSHDTACYIPGQDVIAMPPVGAFDSAEAYAATLNHEACHATGAGHRLHRDLGRRFGDATYCAEELVAEIGASILGAHLHLPPQHIHDHAAYIDHWMKLLNRDARAFLTAATKAQAAVDWLLDKSPPPCSEMPPSDAVPDASNAESEPAGIETTHVPA